MLKNGGEDINEKMKNGGEDINDRRRKFRVEEEEWRGRY